MTFVTWLIQPLLTSRMNHTNPFSINKFCICVFFFFSLVFCSSKNIKNKHLVGTPCSLPFPKQKENSLSSFIDTSLLENILENQKFVYQSNGQFQCNFSNCRKCLYAREMRTHYISHLTGNVKALACKLCHERFRVRNQVENHLKKAHPEQILGDSQKRQREEEKFPQARSTKKARITNDQPNVPLQRNPVLQPIFPVPSPSFHQVTMPKDQITISRNQTAEKGPFQSSGLPQESDSSLPSVLGSQFFYEAAPNTIASLIDYSVLQNLMAPLKFPIIEKSFGNCLKCWSPDPLSCR